MIHDQVRDVANADLEQERKCTKHTPSRCKPVVGG